MTRQEKTEIEKAIEAYRKKVTASPQAAKEALAKTGIYRADGRLTREYSGVDAD